jgi:hypothetical protein
MSQANGTGMADTWKGLIPNTRSASVVPRLPKKENASVTQRPPTLVTKVLHVEASCLEFQNANDLNRSEGVTKG